MRNDDRLQFLIGLGFLDLAEQQRHLRHYIRVLIEGDQQMAADLSRLTVDVQDNTTMVAAANSLLNNLAAEIRANQNDPTALAALATQLESNTSELSNAILANTPEGGGPATPGPTPAQAPDPTAGQTTDANSGGSPVDPGTSDTSPSPSTPGTPDEPVPPSPSTPA